MNRDVDQTPFERLSLAACKKKKTEDKKKMSCEDTFSKGVIRETGLCLQPDTLTTVTETTNTKWKEKVFFIKIPITKAQRLSN